MEHGFIAFKKIFIRKAVWLGCSMLLISLLACRYFPFAADSLPTPSSMPIPNLEELRFTDEETGRRFRDLNAAIKTLVDETWQTIPYHLSGNFYEAAWCLGERVASECQPTTELLEQRGQHILILNTLFYEKDFPQVFGLGFSAHWTPKEAGWGASFDFSEGGGSVVGEGWQVNFRQYLSASDTSQVKLTLGSTYSYIVNETSIVYHTNRSIRTDLALYLAGPQAMRDQGLANIQTLAQQVRTEITSHRVSTCDKEPYNGGGIPPKCNPRPMTAAEEDAELARAEKVFAEQEYLLNHYYQEMYTAWMSAFPFDQQWK